MKDIIKSTISFKDFFGTPLAVGDEVAIMTPAYRDLTLATIVKFTPQQVGVAYPTPNPHNPNAERTFLTYSANIVKKPS